MNQTKVCTKCHIEKQLTEFSKDKSTKDGLQYKCKTCEAEYYQSNRDKKAKQFKAYNQANRDKILKYQKANYQANRDKILKHQKAYQQTPTGKAVKKAGNQNRRARVKNAKGKHTGKQILELFNQQSGACPYCKAKLCKTKRNSFHIDHVIPLSKGGSNDISNIQLLCPKCNMNKHNKTPEVFAAEFGKLF